MSNHTQDSCFCWQPMDAAPKDGTTIVARYEDGPSRIRWSQRPVCMLGSRCGGFPPGWATDGSETDGNLPMDPPQGWMREEDYQNYQDNLRLISSAPELLDALEKIAAVDDAPYEYDARVIQAVAIAEAAIAKVKGGES